MGEGARRVGPIFLAETSGGIATDVRRIRIRATSWPDDASAIADVRVDLSKNNSNYLPRIQRSTRAFA